MRKFLVLLNVLLLVGLAAAGGYYFKKYRDTKAQYDTLKSQTGTDTDKIVDKVSKLYALPSGENPRVQAIASNNIDELRKQTFFQKAENGDYLLIYTAAKLAIIYREKDDKLINVGPITINDQPATKLNVKIMGSEADRDAVEKTLNEKFPNTYIVTKVPSIGAYQETTVVDLKSGANTAAAAQIAGALTNAKTGDFPSTENKPSDADIVIVAGVQQ